MAINSAGALFVGGISPNSTSISEILPGGLQGPFGPLLFATINNYNVTAMAFDSAGDLFVAQVPAPNNYGYNGTIVEITPGGAQSTFASGLDSPAGIAFQPVPEPPVLGLLAVGTAALLVWRRRNLAA
jgi:hypothetical protein